MSLQRLVPEGLGEMLLAGEKAQTWYLGVHSKGQAEGDMCGAAIGASAGSLEPEGGEVANALLGKRTASAVASALLSTSIATPSRRCR